MKLGNAILLALLIPVLTGCAAQLKQDTAPDEQEIKPLTATSVTLAAPTVVTAPAATSAPAATAAPEIAIYSPYSTDGLLTLNEFRSNNSALNDFLVRNRKPDYFFSGLNTEFAYQKIYLVYLESENLYLFDSTLKEPYKRFHPLPESIRKNFKGLIAEKAPNQGAPLTADNKAPEMAYQNSIEKSLASNKPEPYLNAQLLYQVPLEGMSGSTLYPGLYFLDMPLSDLLENQYSAKYDSKKHILKLIFPKAYEAGMLYKKAGTETRKIFVEYKNGSGKELSLVVPDFLPGSDFYRSTHGNISKVFSSLYQINVPPDFTDSNQLHMRYLIKLCQSDIVGHCAVKKNNATYVRAIVIEATLYDHRTRMPIETIVLK